MRLEIRKLLQDVEDSANLIQQFTAGQTVDEYLKNPLVRSGVERQFEIIGEALNRLAKTDPTLASRIEEYREIIAFRNVLIHGYHLIDDLVVWDAVKRKLPKLVEEIARLLGQ